MSRDSICSTTVLTGLSTYRLREELSFLRGYVNPTATQRVLIKRLSDSLSARRASVRRAREEGDHYAKPFPVRK